MNGDRSIAPASRNSESQSGVVTNERTNGRTPDVNPDSDILQLSDVRARVEDSDTVDSTHCEACPFLNCPNCNYQAGENA